MKLQFNLQADKPNSNGNIYPKDTLKKAIEEYNENYVKTGKALGEISQPKDTTPNLSNVAFRISEIETSSSYSPISESYDDRWLAEIEILETPMGKTLQEIFNKDMNIVTMGYGEVEEDEDGNNIIKNFKIVGVGIEPKEKCA